MCESDTLLKESNNIHILIEVKCKHGVKKGGIIIITLMSQSILGGKRSRMIYGLSNSRKLLNSKVVMGVLTWRFPKHSGLAEVNISRGHNFITPNISRNSRLPHTLHSL